MNGYQWKKKDKLVIVGSYLEVECLNKKWTPGNLPECISKTIWAELWLSPGCDS